MFSRAAEVRIHGTIWSGQDVYKRQEEISTFENAVKLEPKDMKDTYLVRSLLPLCDFYVNDAFAAAHRNAPSMVAFQQLLPTAAGLLMQKEVEARCV